MSKRYYWLKLTEDFFEKEEIKLIESQKNGKDYIIFYMKLLLKSIKNEGSLLFRNCIPYTPEMLSTITNTNIDTVNAAIKMFVSLGLMSKLQSGELYMEEINKMIGSESDSAKRMRLKRIKDKQLLENKSSHSDNFVPNCDIEKEKEKDLEKDKDKEKEKIVFLQETENPNCNITEYEIQLEWFNTVWDSYPVKKGKSKITTKSKLKKLYQDKQNVEKALNNYLNDPDLEINKGWRHLKDGSTFFNNYKDYIDYKNEINDPWEEFKNGS